MVGGTFIPQTAFAYKYYVHCDDGDVMKFEFEDKETAKLYFSIFGEHAYLTSRPNGGFLTGF